MPSANWSSTQPRAAWYYTRLPSGANDWGRVYTTWLEIMRDARRNLGLPESPYAWNGEFTAAMRRWLETKGASAAEINLALAPILSPTNPTINTKIVLLAVWAARFPHMRLSDFASPSAGMYARLAVEEAERVGLVFPQYVLQLQIGANTTQVPNSDAPAPGTTGGTPGGTGGTTGTPGTKPPGSPAEIVTGGAGKPEESPFAPPAAGGTGTPGGTTGTTPPPPVPTPTPTNVTTTTGALVQTKSVWSMQTVLLVFGVALLALGVLFKVMSSEDRASPGRAPAY